MLGMEIFPLEEVRGIQKSLTARAAARQAGGGGDPVLEVDGLVASTIFARSIRTSANQQFFEGAGRRDAFGRSTWPTPVRSGPRP